MLGAPLNALVWLIACGPADNAGFARASVIEDLDGAIGGPKAIARTGDLILENDKIRLGILAARTSMGPGLHGGSIVDADLRWDDARFPAGYGRDQLAEIFPTVNLNISKVDTVEIVADGADGGPAIVRTTGGAEPFLTLLLPIWALVKAPDLAMVTEYEIRPGEPWVTIRTTATIPWDGTSAPALTGEVAPGSDDGLPLLPLAVETGAAFGDFYLQGGSIDVFVPDMGFDEDGEVYLAGLAGQNTFLDPFRFPIVTGVGDGLSYGLAPVDGAAYVPLFTSSQTAIFGAGVAGDPELRGRFAPNSAFTYERRFYIGNGDVGSVLDGWMTASAAPSGEVRGQVVESSDRRPVSDIDVFVFRPGAERPYSMWRTDADPRDDVRDGSFGGRLPPGDWELLVHRRGRQDGDRLPVTVVEGESVDVLLASLRPGRVSFEIRDEVGRLVPAKISIFRADGESRQDPVLGDGRVAGWPEAVLFAPYGAIDTELPDGSYVAVASRGVEYEIDWTEPFDVAEGQSHLVPLEVERSVQTDGWVSADLHVHAQPSHDSGVTLEERVATMVCEGVEFFSSTDHDSITNYAPVVEDLGLEPWVQTAIGEETTTIEIGHFLAFPLAIDYLADAFGAFDWTGQTPATIIAAMRAEGQAAGTEPTVFIGHPRDGILGYFDQYGLDPYAGLPGIDGPGAPVIQRPVLSGANDLLKTDNFDLSFDGLEMLNGKRMELIRTPTQAELDAYAAGGEAAMPVYKMIERTMEEQAALDAGTSRVGYGQEGQIDDWFTLLNLGWRFTVLGNSDTHDRTGVESGCPRNFVMAETDDPRFLDDQAVADAVKAHRVVASYGPFVQMWIDGQPIGSDVSTDGEITLSFEVQAPGWIDVDRVELYENGRLIQEFLVPASTDVLRIRQDVPLTPTKDSWYVISVVGDSDLEPVFTTVDIPYIQLQDVVSEALGGIPSLAAFIPAVVPIPRSFPVLPYAITNPIWVDVGGNGWVPPGLPPFMKQGPVAPE